MGVFAFPGTYIPGKDIDARRRQHPRRREPRHDVLGARAGAVATTMTASSTCPTTRRSARAMSTMPASRRSGDRHRPTPNRGDATGVYGIARDLAAFGLGTLKTPPVRRSPAQGETPVKVTLDFGDTRAALPQLRAAAGARRQERPVAEMAAAAAARRSGCGRSTPWSTSPTTSPSTGAGRCTSLTPTRSSATSSCAAPMPARTVLALDNANYTLDDDHVRHRRRRRRRSLGGIMGGEHSGCD